MQVMPAVCVCVCVCVCMQVVPICRWCLYVCMYAGDACMCVCICSVIVISASQETVKSEHYCITYICR